MYSSRTWKLVAGALVGSVLAGCSTSHLENSYAGILDPIPPPSLPPAPVPPAKLPIPPDGEKVLPETGNKNTDNKKESKEPKPAKVQNSAQPEGPLELAEVLKSVDLHFPLLMAAEQDRSIAAGQRLAAEGAFDLSFRTRGVTQGGTFPSNRLDVGFDQPTSLYGLSLYSGYRLGDGSYPVYYGDRQTADGGEFRAGLVLPLLKDGPIDRKRAALRQGQITESLADPTVQRARIDYFRSAARAYWAWVAAGEQYRVAESLLKLAQDRQAGFEAQFNKGQISEFVVIDNRRVIAEREGGLIAADRRFQQTSLDLSLFVRDDEGNPQVPSARRLPSAFAQITPTAPSTERLSEDIKTAYTQRPELVRFQLLKERATVDLRLAQNQSYPSLNAAVGGSQDVGPGKKSPGIFALDRSVVEASLLLEVPLQRREAKGREQAAQATLMQVLAQERFARDQIGAEVQDAVSNLDRTFQRLARARDEQKVAQRVAELERERFEKGQSNLLEVNLRELSAAGAQVKIIDTLADYFRAFADLRAALGSDANRTANP
jgi:cobalt-zinc-cadmium efflux system outer membrane protein